MDFLIKASISKVISIGSTTEYTKKLSEFHGVRGYGLIVQWGFLGLTNWLFDKLFDSIRYTV